MRKTLLASVCCCLILSACKKSPVACIEVDNDVVTTGTAVTFRTCSKKALSYQWYMTGPTGAPENDKAWSEIEFSNTFTVAGSYTVSLTAYQKYSWLGESNTTETIITVN